MNKWLPMLFLLVLCASCTDFWSASTQRSFHEACTESAVKWARSEQEANSYCDCVLRKMMEQYPNEEDAFGHLGELATDTSLINCKQEVINR